MSYAKATDPNRGKLAERECYQSFSPPLYQSPPPLSIYLLSFVLSAPLYHSSLQRSDIASTHQWEDAFVRGLDQSRPLLFLFWGVIWLTAPAWGEWQVAFVSLWQPVCWLEFVLWLKAHSHVVLREHPYVMCGWEYSAICPYRSQIPAICSVAWIKDWNAAKKYRTRE